jgi:predicted ATPase
VPEDALVLIDEPEISLHVGWQVAFIPDIQRIAEIRGLRFIVATHSPQIINGEWNKAVRLGPSDSDF